jgi:hypothetical protein
LKNERKNRRIFKGEETLDIKRVKTWCGGMEEHGK